MHLVQHETARHQAQDLDTNYFINYPDGREIYSPALGGTQLANYMGYGVSVLNNETMMRLKNNPIQIRMKMNMKMKYMYKECN